MAHWDEIVWDYSDFLQADEGTRLHTVAERASQCISGAETELALEQEVSAGGWTLAGRVDHFENGVIIDHKFAKVGYAQMHGKSLEQQLNCYAWLLRTGGREVVGLEGDINLNNWDWRLATFGCPYPYPPIPYENIKVSLWSLGEQRAFILKRLEAHTLLAGSRCSDEERWACKPSYAVMRGERATAVRVCRTKEEAEQYLADKKVPDGWIQTRPGGSIRCKFWCRGIIEFCSYRDEK